MRRDNVPHCVLFLQALPAWRGGQGLLGQVALEGFDRGEVLALMDLRGVPVSERPAAWQALVELESEYRMIRQASKRNGQ